MADKVLLTGGLGFIGHHLALKLREEGLSPIILDNFTQNILNDWHRAVIEERKRLMREADIPIVYCDTRFINPLRQALADLRPDRIVHLSAIPSMVLSNKEPGEAVENNLVATKNLLEIIRLEQLPVKQFMFFSSSTVYGDFKGDSVTEESPTTPKGIYEAAKLSSELVIKAYHNLIGVPYTIIRPSALYGQRCINNRVTQIFIESAMSGKTLRIEGDGEERLDFTYIKDLVHGLFLAMTKEAALNQTFNMTCGHGERLNSLLDILRNYWPDLKVEYIPRDRMKPKRGTLEIGLAQRLLGYQSRYRLAEGYPEYIQWYLDSDFLKLVGK